MESNELRQRVIAELSGPIHGRLVELRGMCTDGEVHEAIDRKATEADDRVHELVELLKAG